MLDQEEIARRLPLWWSLSDLLLDTDMPHLWGLGIARAMLTGGFSLEEAHGIFLQEVGPAFSFNLLLVAGEWVGWEQEFVRDKVLARLRRQSVLRRFGERAMRSSLQALWEHTLPHILAAHQTLDSQVNRTLTETPTNKQQPHN